MRIYIVKNGVTISTSKNLEGLSRYHRKHHVIKSNISKIRGNEGKLHVKFNDGAESFINFASYVILERWIETKRKRSGWK